MNGKILKYPKTPSLLYVPSPVTGILRDFTVEGYPLVECDHDKDHRPRIARMICDVEYADLGKEVLLSFLGDDSGQPVILGILRDTIRNKQNINIFPEDLDENIELSAGLSSITLNPSGRIEIKGVELSISSSGNVHINGENVLLNCDQDQK